MPKVIHFVTGNARKFQEAQEILGSDSNITLVPISIDLTEIQGDPEEVATAKCKEAVGIVNAPVIIDDISLCFDALNGLPGPYVKWFIDRIGVEGTYKLLDGFEDKRAVAMCIFAYGEPGSEVRLFKGVGGGRIVPPRGPRDFGWESIFEPDGHELTYSEMGHSFKNQVSVRSKAVSLLKEYFLNEDC